MKKLCAVAALMLLTIGSASARETGIINQAGPYEAQMRFYLHPALGFPATAEADAPSARADDAKAGGTPAAAGASTAASRASHPPRHPAHHVAVAERG